MTLGKRLERIREERDITRTELARLIGKTESAIWRWEREHRSMSAEVLARVAEVLEVPLSYFFCGKIIDNRDNCMISKECDILQLPVVSQLSSYFEKGDVESIMPLPTTLFGDITPRSFVYVMGTSSKPDIIPDNSHLVVNPEAVLTTGNLALAVRYGTPTVKEVTRKRDGLYLDDEPASDEVYPVGKVVKVLYDPIIRI